MKMNRGRNRAGAVGVIALFVLMGSGLGGPPLEAQDQTTRLREGMERVILQSSQDPEEYEFLHVWKARVRAMRAAREMLERPGRSLSAGQLEQAGAALTGTIQVPVIAGAFSNVAGPYPREEYEQRLFGDGAGAVSVRELYEEMSLGVFSVTGIVTPWIVLTRDRAYYEPSPLTHERYGRRYEFLTESLDAADEAVDFSQFDNDGPDGIPNSGDDDGIVDLVAFLYPTKSMACGGTGIWPHKSHYYWASYEATGAGDFYHTADLAHSGQNILIGDYTIQSGLSCSDESLMGSGTISHELGHGLDLPDLYDVDPNDGTDSEGIGEWGLMASGNYNSVTSPAHFSAWSKDFLGWVAVQTVTSSESGLTLLPILQTGSVLRIDLPSSNEHFLLSNRQPLGSDQFVNGTGLLIWHVDRDLAGGVSEVGNRVNADAHHKGVDLEEADSRDDLDWSRNRGDAGDPFPGSWNAREFHARTYPSSASYAGSPCGIGIRNISRTSGNLSFDISIGEQWVLWGDADGDRSVSASDVSPIYWYFLGYRDAGAQQSVPNGDVDEDGEVDLMDGFILHSFLSGISVPTNRIGESEWLSCDPNEGPEPTTGVAGAVGSGGG